MFNLFRITHLRQTSIDIVTNYFNIRFYLKYLKSYTAKTPVTKINDYKLNMVVRENIIILW